MHPSAQGCCHCGAIAVAFEGARSINEMALRQCSCGFCTRHRARYTSDPDGRLTIIEQREKSLHRYRFGTRTADFLLCRHCGSYLAAVCEIEGRLLAVFNVNNFDGADSLDEHPETMSFAGESVAERLARRAGSWTPAEIRSVDQ